MSKKDKLIAKLKSLPPNFTFDEAETLLSLCSYQRYDKGKTSGSRVKFYSTEKDSHIWLHKPHPRKELLEYQLKQILHTLEKEGLI